MSKLWPIFLFSLLMAYLADKNSVSKIDRNGNKVYVKRDRICFFIMFIAMSLFVGLRTSYNDTGTYRHAYELMGTNFSALSDISYAIGDNPGFNVFNTFLRIWGVSTQSYLMIYALITNGIYLWFIRKYSNNYLLSIFLFSTMGVYTFTLAAIKQCIAIAFALIATDKAINKRYISFVLWILMASTFHPYAIMYVLVPFLNFKVWSEKTYLLLIVFGILGIGLESLLGTVISITTILGEEYNASTFIGEGVNIFRLLVVWVPVFISFVCRKLIKRNETQELNFFLNLSMLTAEIMFIGLFGTANYFARLANYFLIFQVIMLPELINYFTKRSRELVIFLMIVGFLGYFYYGNGIYGGFNSMYKSISIIEYIKSF